MMAYSEEIEELVIKRWAIRKGAREMGGFFEGIALRLNKGVEGEIYGFQFPVHVPFTILFDEIREDAEAIGTFDEE